MAGVGTGDGVGDNGTGDGVAVGACGVGEAKVVAVGGMVGEGRGPAGEQPTCGSTSRSENKSASAGEEDRRMDVDFEWVMAASSMGVLEARVPFRL